MAKTIFLETQGKGTFESPKRAWVALGDHGVREDLHLLSAECVGVWEVEENVARLKKLLDEVLVKARKHFAEGSN